MLCDVVIVAHDSGPLLADAVASASAQAGAAHVWLVDAESTDGSVEAFLAVSAARSAERGEDTGEGRGTTVNLLSVANTGFAAASNRGIEAGSSQFVLLLNPDAALLPGALEALVRAAQTHPGAGIVGALVLNEDGSVQAGSFGRFPSLPTILRLYLWRGAQYLRGNKSLSPKRPPSTTPVDWVTGAAMLVRRAAMDDVGPLDEGFFLYYEDIDWCRRMRARSWEVLLEPQAEVVHRLGTSTAARPETAGAYRESFYRYCELNGLWGLKAAARLGLGARRLVRGAR